MPKSPTVARMELLLRLSQWKTNLNIDPATGAKALKITSNYWHQLFSDRRALTDEHFNAMLNLFGVDDDERESLVGLRRDARERGWWMQYQSLFDDENLRLLGLEYGAESIQSYEGLVVPGLLQTEEYARAIMASDVARIRPLDADLYIEVRMRRQQRLSGSDPLQLTALIHQAALEQLTGNAAVTRGQLQHMASMMTNQPTVDIRIVPFTAATRPILSGSPFHIIYFASPMLSPLVWHESVVTRGIVDDASKIRDLRILFERQLELALSREDSLTLIEQTADRIA
ncbi:Transcriptional regulator [Nocardia ninae]|uniref:Transcriptional regulator n=4 Tax=Nocardia ninae TaxID=356145 RepID=A0A511M9Y2_9NOCA|nr:transcriptional regulator [Nocardia ninae NBRC 108245]